MKKIVFALAGILLLAPLALADTIVLRDGSTVRGTVLGFLNGRIVVRLAPGSGAGTATSAETGSTIPGAQGANDGEIRFFRPNEIERIDIDGRSLEDARYDTRTVNVELGPNWIDSGVDVRRGQRVQVRASGTIYAGRARITPDGLRSTDPSSPLPRAAEGALIGAVGTDPDTPVEVLGVSREFTADRDGRLYLTANRGTYTDARGAYAVRVQTERQLPQRRRDTAGREIEETDDPFDPNRTTRPAPTRSRTPGGRNSNDPLGNRNSNSNREVSVEVPGTSRGTDTGLDLRSGDSVTLTATGQIVAGRRAGSVGPEGAQSTGFGSIISSRPAPNAGVGALIGIIRLADGQTTQAFFVGSQLTFTAQADGRLILLVNDDNYNDNSGSFSVRVRVN